MKNKSFLNKVEDLKPKVPVQKEVEKNLLPRLKLMGSIMAFTTLVTLVFAFMIDEDSPAASPSAQAGFPVLEEIEAASGLSLLVEESELELNPKDVLNFYMVSFVFAAVSASCFLIAWKKKKTLFHNPHHH
jgi:hypothetical protein